MCFFLSFAFACFFFNGCFGFLSDIVIASFPHIHMSNLFPLLCLRYSTVFWQCQPCLLIILCFFCEYDKFTHFASGIVICELAYMLYKHLLRNLFLYIQDIQFPFHLHHQYFQIKNLIPALNQYME